LEDLAVPSDHPAPWIVVPAYQAAATLGDVLDRIPRSLRDGGARLLVVDDGSQDETSAIARGHGAMVLRNHQNLGYGATQKRGISHALDQRATAVVILHADGQYPPESLPQMLSPLEGDEGDVVLGSRVLDGKARSRGMSNARWLVGRMLTGLENLCYGLKLSEYHTGMMAYSRRALEAIPYQAVSDSFHFDGEMAMLAGRRGLRIAEVPIPHVYGREHSYLKPLPYVLTVMIIAFSVPLGLYDRWLKHREADLSRKAVKPTAPHDTAA
jgi:glycosyltransferase involved in cell wall biosynthesis